MIAKDRVREILALALPILGGMLSQNLLNIVDAAMVGHLGPTALAAIGICSFINFMAAALFIGMSVGVQALVGRRVGEGKLNDAAEPLMAGLSINLFLALPLSIVLTFLSPYLLNLILSDRELIQESIPYLQARFMGIAVMSMNFCFRGFFSGIKQTSVYLKTIITVHIINVGLSYVFIFGFGPIPAMGTLGAGIGTSAALAIGTLIYLFYSHRNMQEYGFTLKLPGFAVVKHVARIATPASIQQFFFATGFTVFFWIVSLVGTEQLAVTNVLINVSMLGILPSIGFGIAANTLVSQSLGRGQPDDAYVWAWDVAKVAATASIVIGLLMIVFSKPLLGLFLHQAELVTLAQTVLWIIGISLAIDAVGMVLMNALQGAGATGQVLKVGFILQWVVALPLAYLVGPVAGMGMLAIWLVHLSYRGVQAMCFAGMWKKKDWQKLVI